MSDEGERAGQQIGNYQLTHLLGRGNFADVYLGQHVHLHKGLLLLGLDALC